MRFILLLILVLLVIGVLPTWPYSTGWGYYPSGLGLVLLIVLLEFCFANDRRDETIAGRVNAAIDLFRLTPYAAMASVRESVSAGPVPAVSSRSQEVPA
jgi:hypothetical protein